MAGSCRFVYCIQNLHQHNAVLCGSDAFLSAGNAINKVIDFVLEQTVSGNEGHPEAVLIRGVEGFNGPGKLTKAMYIDRSLNAIDLTISDQLWIEDDGISFPYRTDRRVGIDYADPIDRDRHWRFLADQQNTD